MLDSLLSPIMEMYKSFGFRRPCACETSVSVLKPSSCHLSSVPINPTIYMPTPRRIAVPRIKDQKFSTASLLLTSFHLLHPLHRPRSLVTNRSLLLAPSLVVLHASIRSSPPPPRRTPPQNLFPPPHIHCRHHKSPLPAHHSQHASASTPSTSISHVRALPPCLCLSAAILLVCHLISSEAVIVLYLENKLLNIGETAVDSLCGKLATYITSTTPR